MHTSPFKSLKNWYLLDSGGNCIIDIMLVRSATLAPLLGRLPRRFLVRLRPSITPTVELVDLGFNRHHASEAPLSISGQRAFCGRRMKEISCRLATPRRCRRDPLPSRASDDLTGEETSWYSGPATPNPVP
jgi:hypothetical protein